MQEFSHIAIYKRFLRTISKAVTAKLSISYSYMHITLLIWIDVLKFQVNFDFRGLKGAHFFEVWAPIQGGRLLDISVSRMGSPWNFSHSSIFPSAIKRLESPGWMGIDTHRLIAERCFPGLFEEHVTTRGIYWPPFILDPRSQRAGSYKIGAVIVNV